MFWILVLQYYVRNNFPQVFKPHNWHMSKYSYVFSVCSSFQVSHMCVWGHLTWFKGYMFFFPCPFFLGELVFEEVLGSNLCLQFKICLFIPFTLPYARGVSTWLKGSHLNVKLAWCTLLDNHAKAQVFGNIVLWNDFSF